MNQHDLDVLVGQDAGATLHPFARQRLEADLRRMNIGKRDRLTIQIPAAELVDPEAFAALVAENQEALRAELAERYPNATIEIDVRPPLT